MKMSMFFTCINRCFLAASFAAWIWRRPSPSPKEWLTHTQFCWRPVLCLCCTRLQLVMQMIDKYGHVHAQVWCMGIFDLVFNLQWHYCSSVIACSQKVTSSTCPFSFCLTASIEACQASGWALLCTLFITNLLCQGTDRFMSAHTILAHIMVLLLLVISASAESSVIIAVMVYISIVYRVHVFDDTYLFLYTCLA
jgi:hypothetical protein